MLELGILLNPGSADDPVVPPARSGDLALSILTLVSSPKPQGASPTPVNLASEDGAARAVRHPARVLSCLGAVIEIAADGEALDLLWLRTLGSVEFYPDPANRMAALPAALTSYSFPIVIQRRPRTHTNSVVGGGLKIDSPVASVRATIVAEHRKG